MSSEYGWTDEVIWDLPVARLRQITASIQQRRYLLQRQENQRTSWLARSLGVLIAGGYSIEKGKPNPAMDMAQTFALDDIERALLGTPETESGPTTSNDLPVQPISSEEAIRRALERNGNGSFERFGRMTGQLDQRGKMI